MDNYPTSYMQWTRQRVNVELIVLFVLKDSLIQLKYNFISWIDFASVQLSRDESPGNALSSTLSNKNMYCL